MRTLVTAKNNMTAITTEVTSDLIRLAIDREIKRTIEIRYEELKTEFLKTLEQEKAQTLAGISLYIQKEISYKTMGQDLIITLKTEKK